MEDGAGGSTNETEDDFQGESFRSHRSTTPVSSVDDSSSHSFSFSDAASTSNAGQPSKKRKQKFDAIQGIREDQQQRFEFLKGQLTKMTDSDDAFDKFFASMAELARKLPRKQQIKVNRLVSNVIEQLQEEALMEEEAQHSLFLEISPDDRDPLA